MGSTPPQFRPQMSVIPKRTTTPTQVIQEEYDVSDSEEDEVLNLNL